MIPHDIRLNYHPNMGRELEMTHLLTKVHGGLNRRDRERQGGCFRRPNPSLLENYVLAFASNFHRGVCSVRVQHTPSVVDKWRCAAP